MINNRILDALVNLLRATEGGNQKQIEQAQVGARAAIEEIEDQQHPDDGTVSLHRADSDTAKIVRGRQLLAFVIRSSSGRWTLCDTDRKPLLKVEYSTPKKALAQFLDGV